MDGVNIYILHVYCRWIQTNVILQFDPFSLTFVDVTSKIKTNTLNRYLRKKWNKATFFETEECEDGTYGEDCAIYCSGHCLNESACNKETGLCERGCDPGYMNSLCSDRKTTNSFIQQFFYKQ